jgi:hypothetical protein
MGCNGPYDKVDGFDVSSAELLRDSLARKLIPVADKLRELKTKLGARPYRVRIVRTTWLGGKRGVGPEVVTHELELVPTPLVVDLNALQETVTEVGVVEMGQATVSEISGRYSEDHLLGVDAHGNEPGSADSLYYELEILRPDGCDGQRKRFQLASAPHYNATGFQWTVQLDASIERRQRDGRPASP